MFEISAAAAVDIEEGLVQQATEKLFRTVELDDAYFGEAVELCLNGLNDPNLALDLADGDAVRLNTLASQLVNWNPADDTMYLKAINQAKTQLEGLSRQPDVAPGELAFLAEICARENEIDAAIDYYRRALVLNYSQIKWRYQLARLLARQNKIAEAIHEAKICLRLDSSFDAARYLIEEISVKGLNGESQGR